MKKYLGLVMFLLLGSANQAWAGGWYYQWSCTGDCADWNGADAGTTGPFTTEEECSKDLELRALVWWEYDFGACYEYTEPAHEQLNNNISNTSESKGLSLTRFKLGVVAGPPWEVTQANGEVSIGLGTAGAELEVAFGQPAFGFEGTFGIQASQIQSTALDPGATTLLLFPITAGFTASPKSYRGERLEVRPSLGAAALLVPTGTCSSCGGAGGPVFGGQLKFGLDMYMGRTKGGGLALDVLVPIARAGDLNDPISPSSIEIRPPPVLLRASLLVRDTGLAGW